MFTYTSANLGCTVPLLCGNKAIGCKIQTFVVIVCLFLSTDAQNVEMQHCEITEQIKNLKAEFQALVALARDAYLKRDPDSPANEEQRSQDIDSIIDDYLKDLPTEATGDEMWDTLSNYWNYCNYGLLDYVSCWVNDDEVRQAMWNYTRKLENFKKKTKLCDFLPFSEFTFQRSMIELKKLQVVQACPVRSLYTLVDIADLRMIPISRVFITKSLTMITEKTGEHSVCVTWLVPPSVSLVVKHGVLKIPDSFFKAHAVLSIVFDGCKYYCIRLENFGRYLRMTYDIQRPGFMALQWPPPPTHKVFNLAMIESTGTLQLHPPNDELVGLMMRGKIGDVMGGKTTVQLENLFNFTEYGKRITVLIEGAPGSGKSTMAWHICQKWKAHELYEEFTIVIYVQLRDPEIQSATSIAELLPTHPEIKREQVVAEIESCFGSRVLFVLDGWDEYGFGRCQGSLFHQLICKPEKLHLHHSAVLITSRPIASSELQPFCESRIEILGFTPVEVHQYFEEALGKDSLDVLVLYAQLKERPVIEASCFLPLNAAIVVHLFKELNCTLPTTLHGVFSAVVCGCVRRYLKKQTDREEEISSLDEMPLVVQEVFTNICTLAYEGSVKNKVTFSGQDMKSYGLSVKDNALDLMQVVRSFASRRSELCYFLHLSVQELLTARHISLLPPPKQVSIFNDMFDNPRFAEVFRYYAAFSKLDTEGIRDVVARIARSNKKQPLLNLIHCLYEAQEVSLCCFVASQIKGYLEFHGVSLSPLDCLAVGYFMSCICACNSEKLVVDIGNTSLSGYCVKFLAKGLSSCTLSHSKKYEPLHGCVSLELTASFIQEDEDGLKHLFHSLQTNISVAHLQLHNCNLSFSEDNCPPLVEMLNENRTLREMDIQWNPVGEVGLTAIATGLGGNTGLVRLLLQGCSLEIIGRTGPILRDMLSRNGTLKELDLSINSIGAFGLGFIVEGLKDNTGLVRVLLQFCSLQVTEENGPLLVEMLTKNSTLKELDLSHNPIGPNGLGCIAKGLKDNTGLVKMSLMECSLNVTKDNGPLLVEMLSRNTTLKILDLRGIPVDTTGIDYIEEGLKLNRFVDIHHSRNLRC